MASAYAETRPGTIRRVTGRSALARLQAVLERLGRVVVAFSGGADSALVAAVATRLLGAGQVLCATAVSPSLAPEDLAHCCSDRRRVGLALGGCNDKRARRPRLCAQRPRPLLPLQTRADGRPGAAGRDRTGNGRSGRQSRRSQRPPARDRRRAAERGAVFPLVQAGLDKATVRNVSQALGLSTWDRPAAACLASRVPHGTPGHAWDPGPGRVCRIVLAAARIRRPAGPPLRRSSPESSYPSKTSIVPSTFVTRSSQRSRAAGYRYVTLDLEGLRSGNLSRAAADSTEVRR